MFHAGQQIGSYILISRLGRGGFGEVWLAEKRSQFVTKKLAVKLPLDEQVNFEAIKQEATLWEQASGHPNVLPIIDADIYDGQVVIVSEYADGGSLADKLKREGRVSVGRAAELIIGILSGLEFLHHRRIIHRDIKPQNILLQGNTPRLADFGISRAMQTTAISSAVIGTDAYMAPEAFDGRRSVQSDIWAVGVVLYQLIKGSLPFPQEHPSERMFAILQKEFEPLPNDVPQSLRAIIAKSLAKLPENRYASAAEMREDLQKVLRGETVSSRTASNLRPTLASPTIQLPPTGDPTIQFPQTGDPIFGPPLEGKSEASVLPDQRVQKRERKGLRFLFFSLIFIFLSAIAGGVYFVASRSSQINPNKAQATNTTPPAPGNIAVNFQNTSINTNANVAENVNTGPPPLDAPHIKPEYRTVLEKWFEAKTGWRPATVNDALAGMDKDQRDFAKDSMQSNGKFRHPFYVADDFNADGKPDFALVLISRNRKKYAVAIFNAPFGDSPTYYSEDVEKGDWLFWMKDEFGRRFLIGPPASDNVYAIVPRGNKYIVEANNSGN